MTQIWDMAGGRHDPDRRYGLDRCEDPARHEDGEVPVAVMTQIAVMTLIAAMTQGAMRTARTQLAMRTARCRWRS